MSWRLQYVEIGDRYDVGAGGVGATRNHSSCAVLCVTRFPRSTESDPSESTAERIRIVAQADCGRRNWIGMCRNTDCIMVDSPKESAICSELDRGQYHWPRHVGRGILQTI